MAWTKNAAIWIKKTKKGDTYFSMKAERDIKEGEYLAFFKNNKDGVEKRPDYVSATKPEENSSQNKDIDDINF